MNLKGKKILLTGGCGFIGNEMTRKILEKEPKELVVIDKMSYVSNDNFHKLSNINVHKINIESKEAFDIVSYGCFDIIINMAAESHVDVSIENPNIFIESNVMGTVNILNAIKDKKDKPLFVQISTDEVYGDKLTGESVESDSRFSSSPYSASKASAEFFVESYGRTYGINYIITRSSNNYGPYQHYEKFIPKIINNIKNGEKIPVYGNGLQERDWVYVSDNCNGIISVIESYTKNDIYNIGGITTVTNLDIIYKICSIMKVNAIDYIKYVDDRLGHDKRYCISCDKIKIKTGWVPTTNLHNGLVKTIEWFSK